MSRLSLALVLSLAVACSSARTDDDPSDTTDTDAGTTTETDAGATTDAGTTPDAGTTVTLTLPMTTPVPIRFDTCTSSVCGGDPTGVWTYTDYCAPNPFGQLTSLCAGMQVTKLEGTVSGAAAFGGGKMLRHVETNVTAEAKVPTTCAQLVGGCPGLQNLLANAGLTGTCTLNGTTCDCAATQANTTDDSGDYSVAGSVLTVGARTYEFCIQDGSLGYTDKTQGSAIPGTGTLSKPSSGAP